MKKPFKRNPDFDQYSAPSRREILDQFSAENPGKFPEAIEEILSIPNIFSQLRFPAESSLREEHCCIGVYVRERGGNVEMLLIPYNPGANKEEEKPDHELPEQTLLRGGMEELGLRPTKYELINFKSVPDSRGGSRTHNKHTYLVWEFEEIGEPTDSESPEIHKPIWLPVNLVDILLFEKHKIHLRKAIQTVAMDSHYCKKISGEMLYKYTVEES